MENIIINGASKELLNAKHLIAKQNIIRYFLLQQTAKQEE
jgi:hypothetical protein